MSTSPLISPREIKAKLPLSIEDAAFVRSMREEARKIFLGQSPRIAIIVGPCSIHNIDAALEYAERLQKLSKKVEDSCLLIMRVFTEKSRTTTGWKGLLYDPHLDESHDIESGLYLTRELLLNLAKHKVATATEFVDPLAALYFQDLLSWGFIGARTCSSQIHRQFASSVSMPIGFKNSCDGDIDSAIQGVLVANTSHHFFNIDEEGKLCRHHSPGNLLSHIVLRGSWQLANYDRNTVHATLNKLRSWELNPRLLIDCAHGNSHRCLTKQKEVFHSVLEQVQEGNRNILGLMLESNLEEGSQKLSAGSSTLKSSVSLTDPCLGWSSTEELILSADALLSVSSSCS